MKQKPITVPTTLQDFSKLPPANPWDDTEVSTAVRIDKQPEMVKLKEHVLVPRYNSVYDSLRTPHAWRYMADNYAKGSITTTVNATVLAPITLTLTPNWRLDQWPGAVQVHLVLHFFSIGPTTVPTANAGIECLFFDQFGNVAPLGEFMGQTGGSYTGDYVFPTAITDTGSMQIGTLSVSLANLASSAGTYNYSFGFSSAYILPARYGYEVLEDQKYESRDWTPKDHTHKHHS